MSQLHLLPCLDSEPMAASRRQELNIPREVAAALGRSAVAAAREGLYVTTAGQEVVWRDAVQAACAAKLSSTRTLYFQVRSDARSRNPGSRSPMRPRSERHDASLREACDLWP